MPERQCQWCGKTYPFYEDHDSVECRDALREGITRLTRERDEAREKYEGAVNDWRNACALMNKAEAKLARCVEALEGLVSAWDRAEGGRGCYSCVAAHDARCELDRKISETCTCGRVELDAAAEAASAALAAAKGGE